MHIHTCTHMEGKPAAAVSGKDKTQKPKEISQEFSKFTWLPFGKLTELWKIIIFTGTTHFRFDWAIASSSQTVTNYP